MIEVNEALTRKVAELARLELSEQEVKSFTPQLKAVLGYIDQLSEVDVAGVEPMVHAVELSIPLREDRTEPPALDAQGRPKVLGSAPEVLYDGYKVPPIL